MTDTGKPGMADGNGVPALSRDERERVADLAERLFRRPTQTDLGYNALRVREFGFGSGVPERARAFRELTAVIEARLGAPAWCGGSAKGPQVRWRDERHTLVLEGWSAGADLTVHHTGPLERLDAWYFDHGVGDGEEQVPSHDMLPYLWQLHRHPGERLVGGCDCLGLLPVAAPVTSWPLLEESLGMLLGAWSEQLPATVDDWAGFQLHHCAEDNRGGVVGFTPGTGLFAYVDDHDGDDSPEHASAMRALGWQQRIGQRWKAAFPDPDRRSGTALARIVVADARVRGAKSPADLKVRDISCGDDGRFVLPALGLEEWYWG
ncbi:hypothetical protein [Streptomyces albus]|uniref:hypothetical protein n=1 Tax=Streptomyces albus TaxID=1888 RepID=UPI00131CEF53|nr:hypothetical protein [Streptomyces albus]